MVIISREYYPDGKEKLIRRRYEEKIGSKFSKTYEHVIEKYQNGFIEREYTLHIKLFDNEFDDKYTDT